MLSLCVSPRSVYVSRWSADSVYAGNSEEIADKVAEYVEEIASLELAS